ncbi:hypothetical protein ABID94_003450 [Streptomyces sp. PvR018]
MATLANPLPALASSSLDFPPGSMVDVTLDGPWREPLLWYADGPAAPRAWPGLRPAGQQLGLLPVLVAGGSGDQWPADWDLCPDGTSYPGGRNADEILAGYWTDYADVKRGDGAAADDHDKGPPGPGSWPGLTPVPAGRRPRPRTRRPKGSRASSPPKHGSAERASPWSRPAAAPTYRRRSAGPVR